MLYNDETADSKLGEMCNLCGGMRNGYILNN